MFTDILQPTHLLFILVVALLVLGPKRLPEVARSLGNGLRDFRAAISGEGDTRSENSAPPLAPGDEGQSEPTAVSSPAHPVGPPPANPAMPGGDPAPGSAASAPTAVHEPVPAAPTEEQATPTEPVPAAPEDSSGSPPA